MADELIEPTIEWETVVIDEKQHFRVACVSQSLVSGRRNAWLRLMDISHTTVCPAEDIATCASLRIVINNQDRCDTRV
jgi:hypothetical protein